MKISHVARRTLDILFGKELYCAFLIVVACIYVSAYRGILEVIAHEKLCLIWGMAVLIWDLIQRRDCLRSIGSVWLFAFCIVCIFTSILNGGDWRESIWSSMITIVLMFLCYSAAYGGRRDMLMRLFHVALIVCVLFFSAFSLYKVYNGDNQPISVFPQGMTGGAFYGAWTNPNSFGAVLLTAIAAALLNLQSTWKRGLRGRAVLYGITICILIFFLGATCCRTSIVALLIIAGLVAWFAFERLWKRTRLKNAVLRCLASCVCALAVVMCVQAACDASSVLFAKTLPADTYYRTKPMFSELITAESETDRSAADVQAKAPATMRMMAVQQDNEAPIPDAPDDKQPLVDLDKFTSYRISVWQNGITLWQRAPIFGIGLGNIEEQYAELDPSAPMVHLHSGYLQMLTATGIVGFIIFLLFAWTTASKSIRAMCRFDVNDPAFSRMTLLFSILVGLCAYNLAEVGFAFSFWPVSVCFWIWLGECTQYVPVSERGRMDMDRYWQKLFCRHTQKNKVERQ